MYLRQAYWLQDANTSNQQSRDSLKHLWKLGNYQMENQFSESETKGSKIQESLLTLCIMKTQEREDLIEHQFVCDESFYQHRE